MTTLPTNRMRQFRHRKPLRAKRRRGAAAVEAVLALIFLMGTLSVVCGVAFLMYRESFFVLQSWLRTPYY